MAKYLLNLLFFVALVAGQTASFTPSNDSLPMNMTAPDIELTLSSSSLNHNVYNIAPLTSLAGQGQESNSLAVRYQLLILLDNTGKIANIA